MQKIKGYFQKIKNFKFKEKHFYKLFFIFLVTIIFTILVLNVGSLTFAVNGFSNVLSGELQLYTFYVGQGSSSLIVFPNKTTMLIDTGTPEYANNLCEQIEVILDNNEIESIDYLILTHNHDDHVGGVLKILQKFPIDNIFRPKIFSPIENLQEGCYVSGDSLYSQVIEAVYSEPNCNIVFIEPLEFHIGDFLVKIWTPTKDYYIDENEFSPIITISNSARTLMFTGDATADSEKEFVSLLGVEIEVDFLNVSHHGSGLSSSMEFLNAIHPKYAIISAGVDNIYSHPATETLERLETAGVEEIFITNNVGTVGIAISAEDLKFADMFYLEDVPVLVVLYFCIIFAIAGIKNSGLTNKLKRYKSQQFVIEYQKKHSN